MKYILVILLAAGFSLPLAAQEAQVPGTDNADDPFAAAVLQGGGAPEDDPFSAATATDSAGMTADDPFGAAAGGTSADGTDIDWDTLFSEDNLIQEVADPTAVAAEANSTLVQTGVKWGGSFRGTLSSGFGWENPFLPGMASVLEPDSESLRPATSADLYFSARPEADYRVYGKFKLSASAGNGFNLGGVDLSSLQLTTNDDGSLTIGNPPAEDTEEDEEEEEEEDENTASNLTLNFSVYELFADFSWKDRLFFRFGKAQIAWGVGYFFSPADVLNLTAIDVEDPTADRSGPLNLKMNWPVGINNFDLFLVTDKVTFPKDIAVAPRFSFVAGGTEMGLGAYYQRDLSPRAIATVSSSLDRFSLFAEAVAAWGSDRVYVRPSQLQPDFPEPEEGEDPPIRYTALDTYKIDRGLFFQGTAGFLWQYSDPDLTIAAQYFFNGTGYPDSSLLQDAFYLLNNQDTNGLAVSDSEAQPDDYEDPLQLRNSDLNQWGQHYAALNVGWNNIFDTDLSLSALALLNISDLSGIASVNLGYRFFKRASASFGARYSFGQPGGEYTNPAALFNGPNDPEVYKGPLLDLTLEFSLGGGSF